MRELRQDYRIYLENIFFRTFFYFIYFCNHISRVSQMLWNLRQYSLAPMDGCRSKLGQISDFFNIFHIIFRNVNIASDENSTEFMWKAIKITVRSNDN